MNPRKADRIVAAMLAAMTLVITLVGAYIGLLSEGSKPHVLAALHQHAKAIAYIAVLAAVCAGALYTVNKVVYEERAKRAALQLEIAALRKSLRSVERERQIDIISGIPNQFKFEADLNALLATPYSDDEYQIVMVDLDGFGAINREFSYQKGDEVIEFVAYTLFESMRRNEEIYKRPLAGNPSSDDLWRRIYRKYSGGDEFLIVLRGAQWEALGFLLRMKRQFEEKFQPHIERTILKRPWPLAFHAGVYALRVGDDPPTVISNVEQSLNKARQTGSPRRVYWKPPSHPGSAEAERTYAIAEREFRVER